MDDSTMMTFPDSDVLSTFGTGDSGGVTEIGSAGPSDSPVGIIAGDGAIPVATTDSGASMPSLTQLLGSATPQNAQALGTAIGTAQRNLSLLGSSFTNAQKSAASGNSLSTWWQYASTTDKLIVGIGVVGIIVALMEG